MVALPLLLTRARGTKTGGVVAPNAGVATVTARSVAIVHAVADDDADDARTSAMAHNNTTNAAAFIVVQDLGSHQKMRLKKEVWQTRGRVDHSRGAQARSADVTALCRTACRSSFRGT